MTLTHKLLGAAALCLLIGLPGQAKPQKSTMLTAVTAGAVVTAEQTAAPSVARCTREARIAAPLSTRPPFKRAASCSDPQQHAPRVNN